MTNYIPANEFVTDTMGLILRIERRRLGTIAKSVFEATEAAQATIYIPTLVFAEILYLSEKQKIKTSLQEVKTYLQQYPNYQEYPLSLAVIEATAQINDIRELHDRLIAGTACLLNLNLITNDPIIQGSTWVRTVW